MDLLHIGGDAMVDIGEVIAIVSRDTAMRSRDTRRAIDAAIGSGRIRSISDAPEKSYVLMERNGALTVWSSPHRGGNAAEARSGARLRLERMRPRERQRRQAEDTHRLTKKRFLPVREGERI